MTHNRWRAMQHARRHGAAGSSAKDMLLVLAVISLVGAACFWFPAFWRLVSPSDWGEVVQVVAWGLFMVAGPPTLVSFLVPWSPAGMLLQRLNAKTWGQAVVIACGIFLLFFSWEALSAWWAMRPGLAGSDLPLQLAMVGLISFVIVPALLWAPVSDEEFAEQLRHAQLVARYRIQTEADITILRNTLLRAQQQAIVGFANLAAGERAELAGVMKGLISGLDQTIQEIAGGLSQATAMAFGVQSIEDNPELSRLIHQATDALHDRMIAVEDTSVHTMSSQQIDPREAEWQRYAAQGQATLEQQQQEIAQLQAELQQAQAAAERQIRAISPAVSRTAGHGGARQGAAQPDDDATLLHTIAGELPATFTKADVARLAHVEPDTARKYLRAWRDQGLVSTAGLPNGVYTLTESTR